jgi:hypothetical protein
MTVETTIRKTQVIVATGTTDYDFTFRALLSAPTDIKCTITSAAGVDIELTYTTDYTVAVNSDGIGGTVTLVSPSTYNGLTMTIYRETTNKQESDYSDYGQFPAETLETDIDKRTMIDQEIAEDINRSLKLSITSSIATIELPSPEADKLLGWNAAATAIVNKTPAAVGVSLFDLDDCYDNGSNITVDTERIILTGSVTLGTLKISQTVALVSGYALEVSSTVAQTNSNSELAYFYLPASSSRSCLYLHNDGTGIGLLVDQDGNGIGLNIIQTGAEDAMQIDGGSNCLICLDINQSGDGTMIDGESAGANTGLVIKMTGAISNSAAKLWMSNASATGPVLNIVQASTDTGAESIRITHPKNDGGEIIDINIGSEEGAFQVSCVDAIFRDVVIKLGNGFLWVDTTGTLRIKTSVPTSDTDGTVVGTQT